MKTLTTRFLAAFLMVSGVSFAQSAVEFKAADPIGRNTVQFKTAAPLEDIVGITNKINGQIKVNPNDLRDAATSARFEVDLADLKTGIALRDTHMREQYLQTDKYPTAIFTLERIRKASASTLKPNSIVALTVEGTFELHGVRRKVEVPATVSYVPESESSMPKLPGNLLRVTSEFDIRLADYNIERPQMVILKVGDTARVSLDVFATDAGAEKLTMWMEKMMGGE